MLATFKSKKKTVCINTDKIILIKSQNIDSLYDTRNGQTPYGIFFMYGELEEDWAAVYFTEEEIRDKAFQEITMCDMSKRVVKHTQYVTFECNSIIL